MSAQNPPVVTIVDCDHGDIGIEQEVADRYGFELRLLQAGTEADVLAGAGESVALLTQYTPVTSTLLDALPSVRAVARYGVGVDTIDIAAATARGVTVHNVPDYGTEDVSDHALALALAALRGLSVLDHGVRHGSYALDPVKPVHRFSATTFGVYGLGLIGEATARKARGVGFRVIGTDPRFPPGSTTDAGTQVVSSEELLAESQVLSLHVPLIPQTRHMIDAAVLARMRPGAKLVNTCRGGVVDTAALITALESGRLAGAALDVFEEEPLPAGHRLRDFPQVLLTPHAAWYSEESFAELKRRAMENLLDACSDGPLNNVVNPEVLEPGAVRR